MNLDPISETVTNKIIPDKELNQDFFLKQEWSFSQINHQFQQFNLLINIEEKDVNSAEMDVVYFSCFSGDHRNIGFVYGLYLKKEKNFLVKQIFLLEEFRTQKLIREVLTLFFQQIQENFEIERCFFSYSVGLGKKDPYFLLFQNVSNINVQKEVLLREYLVKTKDFDHTRRLLWWNPQNFQAKGYEAIPWLDCPEEVKQAIFEKESVLKNDKTYLSPFIDDLTPEVQRLSFVLVEKESLRPLGWMINETMDHETVKIKRWYTYMEKRSMRIAPSFAAYVLEEIAKKSKYLIFEVVTGNLSMDKIVVNRYFRPILSKVSNSCKLNIEINVRNRNFQ